MFDVWIVDGLHQPYPVENLSITGSEPYTLNATLADAGYTVDGVLQDADGQAVSGVLIEASVDGVPLLSTVSASDGTYRIGPLAAGDYVLTLTGSGIPAQTEGVTISGDGTLDPVVLSGPTALPFWFPVASMNVPVKTRCLLW